MGNDWSQLKPKNHKNPKNPKKPEVTILWVFKTLKPGQPLSASGTDSRVKNFSLSYFLPENYLIILPFLHSSILPFCQLNRQKMAAEIRLVRPKAPLDAPTRFLYVMNCGPDAGVSLDAAKTLFAPFGPVEEVRIAGLHAMRVFVTFADALSAAAAKEALDEKPCAAVGGRLLKIEYAVPKRPPKVSGLGAGVVLTSSPLLLTSPSAGC